MKVILIAGKKTHGKSTLAGILEEKLTSRGYNIQRLSFAGALKRMAIDVFGLTQSQCFGSDADKNSPTIWKWSDLSPKIRAEWASRATGEYLTAREFMQLFGTDIFRNNFGKDVWVKILYAAVERHYQVRDFVIIDDARFPNEIEMPAGTSGVRILIQRPGVDSKDAHESEKALDGLPEFCFDFIVKNDKSLAELDAKASKIAESITM